MKEKQLKQLNSLRLQSQYEEQANFSSRESDKLYYLHQAEKEKIYQMEIV